MSSGATFERLVAEHEKRVLRVCRSITRDEHLGADAAQETFVRLWRTLGSGRALNEPGAWLRRVAVTTSLDQLRSRRRRDDAEAHETRRRMPAPEEEFDARELEARLERAVARLPEGQRTIFQLRHQGGLSLPQVADTLDLALPTVKTQFARACLKLQRALRPFAPE